MLTTLYASALALVAQPTVPAGRASGAVATREVDRRPARLVAAVDTHDEAVGRYPLLTATLMMIQLRKIAMHEFCIGKRPANR